MCVQIMVSTGEVETTYEGRDLLRLALALVLHHLVLANPTLDAANELLTRGGLTLLVGSVFLVRVGLAVVDARLGGLDLSLLEERLKLNAGEGRVLSVLVEREVLKLLLNRDWSLLLTWERGEERVHHAATAGNGPAHQAGHHAHGHTRHHACGHTRHTGWHTGTWTRSPRRHHARREGLPAWRLLEVGWREARVTGRRKLGEGLVRRDHEGRKRRGSREAWRRELLMALLLVHRRLLHEGLLHRRGTPRATEHLGLDLLESQRPPSLRCARRVGASLRPHLCLDVVERAHRARWGLHRLLLRLERWRARVGERRRSGEERVRIERAPGRRLASGLLLCCRRWLVAKVARGRARKVKVAT